MIDLWLFSLVFLLIAFFSSAEIAYVALSQTQLDQIEKKKFPFAWLPRQLFNDLDKTLLTLLIGGIFSLYIFAIHISWQWLLHRLSWSNIVLNILIITLASLFVILAAKIFPKLIIRHFADYTAIALSPLIKALKIVFFPIIALSKALINVFGRPSMAVDPSKKLYHKLDFETLQPDYHLRDLEKKDKEVLSNIFSIAEVRVKESMVPRTEVHGVSKETTITEIHQEFINTGYSQLPVYDNTIDNIVGIINVHDLFKRPENIEDILKEAIYVPERKKSVELLKEFVSQNQKSAIVVDEFGGTAGFVTSEDLIEELLGDIQDEYDTEDDICRALSKDTFLISGRINIDTINEKFNLGIAKEENYETMAGYILSKIGKIPKAGEIYQIDHLMISILRSGKTKIEMVKVKLTD